MSIAIKFAVFSKSMFILFITLLYESAHLYTLLKLCVKFPLCGLPIAPDAVYQPAVERLVARKILPQPVQNWCHICIYSILRLLCPCCRICPCENRQNRPIPPFFKKAPAFTQRRVYTHTIRRLPAPPHFRPDGKTDPRISAVCSCIVWLKFFSGKRFRVLRV